MTAANAPESTAPQTPLLVLEGLQVSFGRKQILKGLTATLSGRASGLLGPNGAGKTTLLNTLLGFCKPTAGTARVLGLDVRTDSVRVRERLGYMPENEAFVASMSAVRLTALLGELAGLPPREALERAHEALSWVGLSEARYRPLGTYSAGMRQLAKLAQAVVAGPELLILDEPTNSLDPAARARMLRLIKEVRDSGTTRILLSSHVLKDVEDCCDVVLILKEGQVAASCNLAEERRSHRKFLELEVVGNTGPLLELATTRGCECAVSSGGRLKMILPEGVEVADVYAVAARHDIYIRRLSAKRDSLQDIYFKAMEGDRGHLPA